MNYYKHHLGDYSKDTAGLTMLEHGAYRLLIDAYYASEAPIPADEVYAIAKAGSALERRAVDKVLRKFFVADGETWTQKRVEEELAHYRERADKNRANGLQGGRPTNNPPVNPKRTQSVSKKNPEITLANNQEPITKKKQTTKTALPDGFGISEGVKQWAQERGYSHLEDHLACFLDYVRANGKTYADWDAALRNCIKGNWAKVSTGGGAKSLPSYT